MIHAASFGLRYSASIRIVSRAFCAAAGLKKVEGIDLSVEDKAFVIRINRPKKFNALSMEMFTGVAEALEKSQKCTDTTVTVLAGSLVLKYSNQLSGAGDFFTAGIDLTNFIKAFTSSKDDVRKMAEATRTVVHSFIVSLVVHEKPLIALVNGPAIGVGTTLLPLCDYAIASDKSYFMAPFTSIGMCSEACSTYSFPLLLGQLRAAQVLLFGEKIGAAEAKNWGLINEVLSAEKFVEEANERVKKFSSLPPESLRIGKKLLRQAHKEKLLKANTTELDQLVKCWQGAECAAAVEKFVKKSKN